MSTLPRTRNSVASDSKSATLKNRGKPRPSSLTDASWHKIVPSGQDPKLKRIPSQANDLSTTVPTSLVVKSLGQRHTPTRTSLRHSRMAVMTRNPTVLQNRRPTHTEGVGRLSMLVISAQLVVGGMGISLAMWLLQWAPFLDFREVPHYSGAMVFTGGILAAVSRASSSIRVKCLTAFLKISLIIVLLASVMSCTCVCAFTTLHLITLAPMECSMRFSSQPTAVSFSEVSSDGPATKDLPHEGGPEGSGAVFYGDSFSDDELEYDFPVDPEREVKTSPVSTFEIRLSEVPEANGSVCVCDTRKEGWRIVRNYYNISCSEVKNILPVFFVASCLVMSVGGVLSSILLYLLWISRRNPFRSNRAPFRRSETNPVRRSETNPFRRSETNSFRRSETNPFLLKSNVPTSQNMPRNGVYNNDAFCKR